MDTQNQNKEHWLNLIIDRLTGTISEDSDLCLQEWLDASDENSRYFKNMEQLWDSMEVVREGEQYDSDRAFSLFQQRVRTESTINTQKSFTLKKVLSYAAILISFIDLSILHSFFRSEYYPIVRNHSSQRFKNKIDITRRNESLAECRFKNPV